LGAASGKRGIVSFERCRLRVQNLHHSEPRREDSENARLRKKVKKRHFRSKDLINDPPSSLTEKEKEFLTSHGTKEKGKTHSNHDKVPSKKKKK